MIKKHKLEEIKEFSENTFLNYKAERQVDGAFIDSLSEDAKLLIKFLLYKQAFKAKKILFNVTEFNRFNTHINMADPSDGIVELCIKELLAKTKDANVYWVNKDLFYHWSLST